MTGSLPPFFILSCARSGSTSLAEILNSAENCTCQVEPMPNLNRETREVMDGLRDDRAQIVREAIAPRVREHSKPGVTYGEKNVTYGPFVRALSEEFECRFVFLIRDGRDVVTSLINWHEARFGNIYRECREAGSLSQEAICSAAGFPVEEDSSDFARPRPAPADPLYHQWEKLSRLEMCAWYWSKINELYLNELDDLPPGNWHRIDYTHPISDDVLSLARRLGIEGLEAEGVQADLDRRINSLEERFGEEGRFPRWTNWSSVQRQRFDAIAAQAMGRLGYYTRWETRYRPSNYAEWWKQHQGGLEWYTWMYESRRTVHRQFVEWVRSRERAGDRIDTLLDVGCGMGVGYAEAFADKRYTGLDLCPRNIEWCRRNREDPGHNYLCSDFLESPPAEKFDVVFSSGTADNSYDLEAYIETMVRCSSNWIYLTLYRGWFPERREHKYSWDESTTCFYIDASPARIREQLERLGCREVSLEPVPTDNPEVRYETRVTARVPRR